MQKFWIGLFFMGALFFGLVGCPLYAVEAEANQPIKQKINLTIHINISHNVRALDSCRVYPYPVAPPHRRSQIQPLSIKSSEIQNQLKGLGYTAITKIDKPYPSGGWRMQNAFRAALAKSGIGIPHTIITMYPWLEDMEPYLRAEIIRINEIEKDRNQRYQLAQQVFDEHRADMEVQAFNDGLFPQDVPLHPWHGVKKSGTVLLQKANWWIVAFQKVPGLQFYWLWPVRLSDEPEQLVELNEDNAIHVDGGW